MFPYCIKVSPQSIFKRAPRPMVDVRLNLYAIRMLRPLCHTKVTGSDFQSTKLRWWTNLAVISINRCTAY
jgi:hypothetical protein